MFSPIPVESQSMLAPTFSVIHNFSGPQGAEPYAGLTIDGAGNLYGTTGVGGNTGGNCGAGGCGTVFKLTQWQGAWTLNRLYSFAGGNDGRDPAARVVRSRRQPLRHHCVWRKHRRQLRDRRLRHRFQAEPPAHSLQNRSLFLEEPPGTGSWEAGRMATNHRTATSFSIRQAASTARPSLEAQETAGDSTCAPCTS